MDTLFSDTDSEGFTETEDIDSMYGGKAQNILSSLEESIGKIDDFLSFERGFMHGDIVCSVADPSGQLGRVLNIEMIVDLENVFGRVIKDVNSKKLLKMRSISAGDFVACGPWLGKVDKVIDCVTILFDDGSKRAVMATDEVKILPLSPNLIEDSQYIYYPGQRVQVRLSTISKSANWLCGTWKENCDEGTISSIESGVVDVDWLASAQFGSDSRLPTPSCSQNSKDLTLLSCLSHANWQLGDWCILPTPEGTGRMDQVMFRRSNVSSYLDEVFVIAKTKSRVDVLWQNGSYSLGLDSHTLSPTNIIDAHEFLPGQFVIEKICDDRNVTNSNKWGVVRCVDAKEKTVKVKWECMSTNHLKILEENSIEEMVSAYELVEHPNYSFAFGDFVFRAVSNLLVGQGDAHSYNGQVSSEMGMAEEASPVKQFLSHIGNVTGFKDGCVEVKWATGFTTMVAPCEIISIDKHEDSVTNSMDHEDSVTNSMDHEENTEGFNEEMIGHAIQSSAHRENDLFGYDGVSEDCKKHPWESNALFLPRAAIDFFTNVAVKVFGSIGPASLPDPVSSGHEPTNHHNNDESEPCNLCTESEPVIDDDLQISKATFSMQEDSDVGGNKNILILTSTENPDQFRQFDMVADCSDHHFFDDAGKELATSQVKKEWLKKVQQEWIILGKNLPESIFVRGYEERIDLMRAAIVGAAGTPYHNGLFFFDIFLPPEYPHQPPFVHYHSGGLRVNPNLYESGKVCLSLLNTWTGRGTEVWNPLSSTILQVLLSLQALVLNEKPYFNEAGYDTQMGKFEGEKNSVSYNENAHLVSCKSMLYILKKPPKHFEELVKEHFSRHSGDILMACKAYMKGAPLGWGIDISKNKEESQKGSSMGFKIMLSKLFPKLVDAFSSKGIDCTQFIELEK